MKLILVNENLEIPILDELINSDYKIEFKMLKKDTVILASELAIRLHNLMHLPLKNELHTNLRNSLNNTIK